MNGSWLISYLPSFEKKVAMLLFTMPWLFRSCLNWNNIDLLVFVIPKTIYLMLVISLLMIPYHPSWYEHWFPDCLKGCYCALFMMTTNAILYGICRKMWMIIYFLVMPNLVFKILWHKYRMTHLPTLSSLQLFRRWLQLSYSMISFNVGCVPAFYHFQLMEKISKTHGVRKNGPVWTRYVHPSFRMA